MFNLFEVYFMIELILCFVKFPIIYFSIEHSSLYEAELHLNLVLWIYLHWNHHLNYSPKTLSDFLNRKINELLM
jgi:hypothetical protein